MRIAEYIKRHRWDLAFVDDEWNFRFIDTRYKDRWFADPFILSVNGPDVIVLAEEFSYKLGKGRIARLHIDAETCTLVDMEIILELDTHLSFPAIFRRGVSTYIYPENSASGSCILYRYDDESRTVERASTLCSAPLTDAVLYPIGSRNLLFSTSLPSPNGKDLGVYSADNPFSVYRLEKKVIFHNFVARNAGNFFIRNDKVIRPAQIGDGGYGYGLGIEFQIMETDNGNFLFSVLERKFPPEGYDGMHTYNSLGNLHIVDCRRYLHPGLRGFLHRIKHGRKA